MGWLKPLFSLFRRKKKAKKAKDLETGFKHGEEKHPQLHRVQRPSQPHVELHHPQLPSKPHSPPQPVGEQEPQLPPKPQRPAQPHAELQQPELPPKKPHHPAPKRPAPRPPQQDHQVTDQEQQPQHEHWTVPADSDVQQPQLDQVIRPSLNKLYPRLDVPVQQSKHDHWTSPSLNKLHQDLGREPKHDHWTRPSPNNLYPDISSLLGDLDEEYCDQEVILESQNQLPYIDENVEEEGRLPNCQKLYPELHRIAEVDHNKKQPSPNEIGERIFNETSKNEEEHWPSWDKIEDHSINEVTREVENAETIDPYYVVENKNEKETFSNGERDDSFIYTIEDLDSDGESDEEAEDYNKNEAFVEDEEVQTLPLGAKAGLVLKAMVLAGDFGRNLVSVDYNGFCVSNYRLPKKALARHFTKVALTKESAITVSDRRYHFIETNTVFERPSSFDLLYLEGHGHRIISERPLRTIVCQWTEEGDWIAEEKGKCFAIFSLANKSNVHLLAKASLCTRIE